MSIIITIIRKNGKGRTFMFGTPMKVLTAAIGTCISVIQRTADQTGMKKDVIKKLLFTETERLMEQSEVQDDNH